jgi:hypothetical protein
MDVENQVVVPPSLPRLLFGLVVGGLGIVVGFLFIFGQGIAFTIVSSGVSGLAFLGFVVSVIRRRPPVVITAAGFTVYTLFGEKSQKWDDIQGAFARTRIGLINAVGYNLTAEYKASTGKKRTTRVSGYDDGITGAFAISTEKLAELLNKHSRDVSRAVAGPVNSKPG